MPKFILPAGEYFIGDPSYSFRGKDWDEAIDLIFGQDGFSKTHKHNGHVFCAISTQDGDGTFEDSKGRLYPVDTALLGAVSRGLVNDQDVHKLSEGEVFGHWVTFTEPVECGYDAGVVYFGGITIDTRSESTFDDPDVDSEFDDDYENTSYFRED